MSYLENQTELLAKLSKTIEKEGNQNSDSPRRFDVVKVLLKMVDVQGQVIQEVLDPAQPLHLKVGEFELMKGMNLALTTMKVGETATFHIPSELCYEQSTGEPADQADGKTEDRSVIVTITLLDLDKNTKVTKWDLEEEEKLGFASGLKEQGNLFFKSKDWQLAEEKYAQAIEIVEWDQSPRRKDLKVLTLFNLSLSLCYQNKFVSALEKINWAINLRPNSAKAHFRKASIFQFMEEHEKALDELKKANELEPENQEIIAQMAKVSSQIQEYREKSSQLYGKMFQKGVYEQRNKCPYSDNLNQLIECEIHFKESVICAKVELFTNILPDTCNVVEKLVKQGRLSRYRSTTVVADNYVVFDLSQDATEEGEVQTTFRPENKSTKIKDAGYLYFKPDEEGNCSREICLSLAPLPWFDNACVPFGFVCNPLDFLEKVNSMVKAQSKVEESGMIKLRACKLF